MACENCQSSNPYLIEFDQSGTVTTCQECGFKPKAKKLQAKAEPMVLAKPGESIVEQVRARLAAIEIDIERLESLRRERTTLRAMLRAADKKR
jgi:uncharacterized OB-fold protein